MVSLTTSDNEQFTVDRDVAERSVLIKQMLEGELIVGSYGSILSYHGAYINFSWPKSNPSDIGDTDQPIPLPNVSSNVLKKVSTICQPSAS